MYQINHYQNLKKYLPKGYLIAIAEECGASKSFINKVLRGLRNDTKGVLVEAYKIANEEKKRQEKEAKELSLLEKTFLK